MRRWSIPMNGLSWCGSSAGRSRRWSFPSTTLPARWKRHQDDCTCCRCDHAMSSSGRIQSSASAASLSNAVSEIPDSSGRIVTNARRGFGNWIGSNSRTLPCSSIVASTVCNMTTSSLHLKLYTRTFHSGPTDFGDLGSSLPGFDTTLKPPPVSSVTPTASTARSELR